MVGVCVNVFVGVTVWVGVLVGVFVGVKVLVGVLVWVIVGVIVGVGHGGQLKQSPDVLYVLPFQVKVDGEVVVPDVL